MPYAPKSHVRFPDCAECGTTFCTRQCGTGRTALCSNECRRTYTNRRMREYQRGRDAYTLRKRHPITCTECGARAMAAASGSKFCSATCCAKANGRRGYPALVPDGDNPTSKNDRRRGREREAFVSTVNRQRVFDADGYRCHMCGRKCLRNRKAPHPRAATVDHLLPLARGGTHEPVNCRTACYRCNVVKGDRGGGEQLLLIS